MTAFTLRVERYRVTQALQLGCTLTESQFLDTLRCEGPLSVNDIGERLRMGHAVVSNIAERLERKGFVGRGCFAATGDAAVTTAARLDEMPPLHQPPRRIRRRFRPPIARWPRFPRIPRILRDETTAPIVTADPDQRR